MLIHFEMPTEYKPARTRQSVRSMSSWFPIDVIESENGTTVYAELPGVPKTDMRITFEDDVLTIAGKRPQKEIPEDARVLLHEQRVLDFERSIMLGHPVDQEELTASLENGLLMVELPKAAAAKPKTIDIT